MFISTGIFTTLPLRPIILGLYRIWPKLGKPNSIQKKSVIISHFSTNWLIHHFDLSFWTNIHRVSQSFIVCACAKKSNCRKYDDLKLSGRPFQEYKKFSCSITSIPVIVRYFYSKVHVSTEMFWSSWHCYWVYLFLWFRLLYGANIMILLSYDMCWNIANWLNCISNCYEPDTETRVADASRMAMASNWLHSGTKIIVDIYSKESKVPSL